MATGKIKVIHYFSKPISCSLYINTFQCSTAVVAEYQKRIQNPVQYLP